MGFVIPSETKTASSVSSNPGFLDYDMMPSNLDVERKMDTIISTASGVAAAAAAMARSAAPQDLVSFATSTATATMTLNFHI